MSANPPSNDGNNDPAQVTSTNRVQRKRSTGLQFVSKKSRTGMSDASDVSVDIDEFNCAVCLCECQLPFKTVCKHTFCFLCLKGVIQAATYQAPNCPLCRTPIDLDHMKQSATVQAQEFLEDLDGEYIWRYAGRNGGFWLYDTSHMQVLEDGYVKFNEWQAQERLRQSAVIQLQLDLQQMLIATQPLNDDDAVVDIVADVNPADDGVVVKASDDSLFAFPPNTALSAQPKMNDNNNDSDDDNDNDGEQLNATLDLHQDDMDDEDHMDEDEDEDDEDEDHGNGGPRFGRRAVPVLDAAEIQRRADFEKAKTSIIIVSGTEYIVDFADMVQYAKNTPYLKRNVQRAKKDANDPSNKGVSGVRFVN